MSASRYSQRAVSLARAVSAVPSCHARSVATTASTIRRVVRARRPAEITTIDPLPLTNPEANPVYLVRNAVALERPRSVVQAYRLCQNREGTLAHLTAKDLEGILAAATTLPLKDSKTLVDDVLRDIRTLQLKTSPEVNAAIVTALAHTSSVEAAVRFAKTLESLSGPVLDALVSVLALNGRPSAALRLISRGSPSEQHFAVVIEGFAQIGAMNDAMRVYGDMTTAGYTATPAVLVSLINACAALGKVTSATKYFNELSRRNLPQTSDAWTALLRVHAVRGILSEAISTYRRMRSAGVEASPQTFAYLIEAHGKAKDLAGAVRFFYKKENVRGFRQSADMFRALVDAYVTAEQPELAWRVVGHMVKTLGSDYSSSTVRSLAKDLVGKHPSYVEDMLRTSDVSADEAALLASRIMEALVESSEMSTAVALYNLLPEAGIRLAVSTKELAILAMGSSGDVAGAQSAFEMISTPTEKAYVNLMTVHASKGDKAATMDVFEKMRSAGFVATGAAYSQLFKVLGVAAGNADVAQVRALVSEMSNCGVIPHEVREQILEQAITVSGSAAAIDSLAV
ncbi:hypothetical protein BC832DRAFT_545305 [Gaertneriomyces semiglobifer]|nr:hypothetical protein BC832DRAFT_545305 [Gaertneriomyces semiglobifer]